MVCAGAAACSSHNSTVLPQVENGSPKALRPNVMPLRVNCGALTRHACAHASPPNRAKPPAEARRRVLRNRDVIAQTPRQLDEAGHGLSTTVGQSGHNPAMRCPSVGDGPAQGSGRPRVFSPFGKQFHRCRRKGVNDQIARPCRLPHINLRQGLHE